MGTFAHARMNEVGFQGVNALFLGRIGLNCVELNTNIIVKNNSRLCWLVCLNQNGN